MSIRLDILQIFADNRKREDQVRALVEYVEGYELISDAYPRNTHQAIETVEIYGLVIGVDANGYASEVSFPDGAQVG